MGINNLQLPIRNYQFGETVGNWQVGNLQSTAPDGKAEGSRQMGQAYAEKKVRNLLDPDCTRVRSIERNF
ncbi:hypothetical protein IQ249_15085 [Lusitaniella coriacea LEGE 07157]|uniref:Uncharacterized protein n=1 Tax=Lusitaniella coriacea LEGE 07157 TaxID=945747 RepID=A0A8J7IVF3_9CYAN|nr:hypothetical protein [Lusitaniella coriacea LEGE 07157]